MKLYSVSMLFSKPIPGGVNNLISAKTIWANSEEEAFGTAYNMAEEKYRDEGYTLQLKVTYEISDEFIKTHKNEQYSNNSEIN